MAIHQKNWNCYKYWEWRSFVFCGGTDCLCCYCVNHHWKQGFPTYVLCDIFSSRVFYVFTKDSSEWQCMLKQHGLKCNNMPKNIAVHVCFAVLHNSHHIVSTNKILGSLSLNFYFYKLVWCYISEAFFNQTESTGLNLKYAVNPWSPHTSFFGWFDPHVSVE